MLNWIIEVGEAYWLAEWTLDQKKAVEGLARVTVLGQDVHLLLSKSFPPFPPPHLLGDSMDAKKLS